MIISGGQKRHVLIYKKAKFIDQFVDNYMKIRRRKTFPHREVTSIIHFLFPASSYAGRGAYKTVHKVSSRAKDLVLKISHRKNIRHDECVYEKLPTSIRNRYFAKIYWRTKYCLLQKYGVESKVPPERLEKLKATARKHGLTDIRPANVRKVDGHFKIVDASRRKRRE